MLTSSELDFSEPLPEEPADPLNAWSLDDEILSLIEVEIWGGERLSIYRERND